MAAARDLARVPFAALDDRSVASRLRSDPDVSEADIRSNVFGRAVITIRLRRPVARVVSTGRVFLDPDGNLFASRQEPGPLPLLSLPPEAVRAGAALSGPVEGQALVRLLSSAQRLFPQETCSLAVDARGVIFLTLEHGGVVEFGSTEDLEQKVGALGKILGARPGLMRQVRRLNLTSPERPVVVRR
jgi:hypothetical protein